MISWEEYSNEFAKLSALAEKRRKSYLALFYAIAAILVLFVITFIFHPLKHMGIVLPNSVSTTGWGPGSYIIFILGSFAWILFPVIMYRGMNSMAGMLPTFGQPFSLKDDVYSKVFHLFGNVEFAPHGGISPVETRKSVILPEHTLYTSEDYIVTQMHDITVKVCEAEFAKVAQHHKIAEFKGLLLVCDISEVRVKLREGFHGRTALINDEQKAIAEITHRFSGMKRFALPEKYESILEGYTSDAQEAQNVISSELLDMVNDLAQQAKALKRQKERWDDKLAFTSSALYDYWKNLFINARSPALPAEIAYDKQHSVALDMSKSDPLDNTPTGLNRQFEIEYFEDKFIITIPCIFDLFELGSLFEPALNEEDARFSYALITFMDKLSKHLSQVEK